MTHYRIYELGRSGQVVRSEDAYCHDDGEALAIAEALTEMGNSAEVWRGCRLLGRLDPSEQREQRAGTVLGFRQR